MKCRMLRFLLRTALSLMKTWQPLSEIVAPKNFSLINMDWTPRNIRSILTKMRTISSLLTTCCGSKLLDSLYAGMNESDSLSRKRAIKESAIRKIVGAMDTLSLALTKQPSARFKEKLPNNAYFMNFRQYQAKQTVFGEEWRTRFGGDLKAYIVYLSNKYPFL